MSKGFRFLKAVFALINPKTWGVFTETFEVTKFDAAFSISYSQSGEDIALLSFLENDPSISSSEEKTYIDVGAHDPNRFSVTRRLYDLGWRGINIDANKELESKFLKWRKRDKFIYAAVGSKEEYTFHTFEERAISTSNPDWKNQALARGNRIVRTERVNGIQLKSVLEEHFPTGVGLVNIDIEGNDEEALNSLQLELLPSLLKPKWILLETSPPVSSALKSGAVCYAQENGYEPWLVLGMSTLLKRVD